MKLTISFKQSSRDCSPPQWYTEDFKKEHFDHGTPIMCSFLQFCWFEICYITLVLLCILSAYFIVYMTFLSARSDWLGCKQVPHSQADLFLASSIQCGDHHHDWKWFARFHFDFGHNCCINEVLVIFGTHGIWILWLDTLISKCEVRLGNLLCQEELSKIWVTKLWFLNGFLILLISDYVHNLFLEYPWIHLLMLTSGGDCHPLFTKYFLQALNLGSVLVVDHNR